MFQTLFPPKPGSLIPLLCLDCKKMFIGPNPSRNTIFGDLFSKMEKPKCPYCGSKKIVQHPGIHF